MFSTWTKLVNLIIRPPRAEYDPERHLPGPRFKLGGVPCVRADLELRGALGLRLRCSHYRGEAFAGATEPSPCVIYLHGNSGSRCDATEAVRLLLPMGIDVFALDFGGSGASEGEHVSLGAREKEDVSRVIKHLRGSRRTGKIGLWGTSMGAVTALLAANEDPSVAGIVLDSPFASLRDLMIELVEKWTRGALVSVPRAATRIAAGWMRSSVKTRANFDIDTLEIETIASATFCPALFAHGDEDDFIDKQHSIRLKAKYAGDAKPLLVFEGDHNSPRPTLFFEEVRSFFQQTLWETPAETAARRRRRESERESERESDRESSRLGADVPRGRTPSAAAARRADLGETDRDVDRGLGLTPPDGVRLCGRTRYGERNETYEDSSIDRSDPRAVVRVRDVLGSPDASPPSEEALSSLRAMGFETPRAKYALRRARGNLDAAVVFLLDDDVSSVDGNRSIGFGNRAESTQRNSAATEAEAAEASDADFAEALRLSLELVDRGNRAP
jgi:pimeloyl-ACP methyl ester carboxylesterase